MAKARDEVADHRTQEGSPPRAACGVSWSSAIQRAYLTLEGQLRNLVQLVPGSDGPIIPDVDVDSVRCPAVTVPPKIDGTNAYAVEDPYTCELPVDHAGPHYSILDSLEPDSTPDGDDIWLRWESGRNSVHEIKAMCPASHEGGEACGGEGICTLYDGHPGPHTDECASRWQ